ncbi:winged helix-turn-helix transcriptional regulator [Streptomyces sp. NPDC007088]|uniref:winged helix-turn-helix transcriptional regulator n=1 Tax=Streptomyces sp. NPDC007088 TaxID=3364773 RepID=UPI0036ACCAB7
MVGIGEYSDEGVGGAGTQPCGQVDRSITLVFGLLGKRWSGPIVSVLLQQPVHFSELRRAIPGISERMLSDRLSELTSAGLVVREVDEGPPLRVVYRPTEAGAALGPALEELAQWAETHLVDDEGRNPCTEAAAATRAVAEGRGRAEGDAVC